MFRLWLENEQFHQMFAAFSKDPKLSGIFADVLEDHGVDQQLLALCRQFPDCDEGIVKGVVRRLGTESCSVKNTKVMVEHYGGSDASRLIWVMPKVDENGFDQYRISALVKGGWREKPPEGRPQRRGDRWEYQDGSVAYSENPNWILHPSSVEAYGRDKRFYKHGHPMALLQYFSSSFDKEKVRDAVAALLLWTMCQRRGAS